MADTEVEPRTVSRYFCHRCNVEFNHMLVLQDFTCPFCNSGFVEQLESGTDVQDRSGDDFTDADMSNIGDMSGIDETEDASERSRDMTAIYNDMAFIMAAAGLRTPSGPPGGQFVQELMMMLENGASRSGVATAGVPLVFVGAPGDYVLGGEGLDAVVTQMLGQLDNSGPPPLSGEQLEALPTETVTAEQAAQNTTCSICWENFLEGEAVSRLECLHMYHSTCIRPWLQLHATCPICRRSLIPPAAPGDPAQQPRIDMSTPSLPRVFLRRLTRRAQSTVPQTQTWDSLADSSSTSGSTSTTSSVTTGGVWAPQRSTSNSTGSNSTTSLNSSNDRERQYNMDIDYD